MRKSKRLKSERPEPRALKVTLVSAAVATAVLESAHVLVHAHGGFFTGAIVVGALIALGFVMAVTATLGGLLFVAVKRLSSADRAFRALQAPARLLCRLWSGEDEHLTLTGHVFDVLCSTLVFFALTALTAYSVILQFHEPVRMSLLIAAIGAALAPPVFWGVPRGLGFLRARLSLSPRIRRMATRAGIIGIGLGGLIGIAGMILYKDEIFGAVDPYPVAMVILFFALLFVLPAVSSVRPVAALGRVPFFALASAGLVLGVALSSFSEGARGVVDKAGAVSGVVYRTLYRLLDMDDDGFAWIIGGDCHPLDAEAGPFALEIPGNGFDEDCDGADTGGVSGDYSDPLARAERAPESLRRAKGNVLLIICDATAANHLKMYGRGRETMPAVERFAAKNIIFENAFSLANHTSVSMAAMLTGRYPSFFPQIRSRGWNSFALPAESKPIQVRMARAGYQTYMTAGHRLGGFLRKFQHIERGPDHRLTADEVGRLALDQLTAIGPHPKKPVFFGVHFIDPHHPYRAKERPFRFGPSAMDKHDGELAYVDQNLAPVLKLVSSKAYRDWLVVFTSDHGEAFYEHGKPHHGFSLYNEEVKVPLVMRVPGVGKRRISMAVSHLDLIPTVLDWSGLEGDPALEGRSLLPLLSPGLRTGPSDARIVFYEFFRTGEVFGASNGRLTLIFNKLQNRFELYDTRRDPRQQKDIYVKGRAQEMERQLRRHVRESLKRLTEGE